MAINEREIVLEMLLRNEEGELGHKILRESLDNLSYVDKARRAFITRVYNGTVEKRIFLDYVLNQYSKTPVKKMKPFIRSLMELTVYQIMEMDRVPDSAAINEAVNLTKKRGFVGLSGFVNGVLRNIARNKEAVSLPDKETNLRKYLEICYSTPEWLVERMIKEYGADGEKILEAFSKKKDITIRVNTAKIKEEELLEKLTKEEVKVRRSNIIKDSLVVEEMDSFHFLPSFHEGDFFVQDESSQLACLLSGVKKGDRILDLCAAPGGKSLLLSLLVGEEGEVISCDISDYKLSIIEDNITRMGRKNIKIMLNDARLFREEFKEKADLVICDLPCSGLGVIGRKKDIKYHASEEKIKELSKIQGEILSQAIKYVKVGGSLIFSTCTMTQEENEGNFKFLEAQEGFEAVDFSSFLPKAMREIEGFSKIEDEAKKGYLRVMPYYFGSDGFFISKFVRKS